MDVFIFHAIWEHLRPDFNTRAKGHCVFFSGRKERVPKVRRCCTPNYKKIRTRAIFNKSSNRLYISEESLINLVYSLSMIEQLFLLGKIRRRSTLKRLRFLLFSLSDIDYRYRNKMSTQSYTACINQRKCVRLFDILICCLDTRIKT